MQVQRDPTSGKLQGFKEVLVDGGSGTAQSSLSFSRKHGPPEEAVRGNKQNYPFWPGGFDEIDLNSIAASSNIDSSQEIDFENSK